MRREVCRQKGFIGGIGEGDFGDSAKGETTEAGKEAAFGAEAKEEGLSEHLAGQNLPGCWKIKEGKEEGKEMSHGD